MGTSPVPELTVSERRTPRRAWNAVRAVVIASGLLLAGGSLPATAQSLIFDDEIEELLKDYARPILKAAGLERGEIKMQIVNDRSFNAFVLDGRNVFLHTGTLMQADTPNQVIGVIAHEVGHIDGAHLAALRSDLARAQTQMLLARLLGIGAAIAARSGEAIVAGDELIVRGILSRRRAPGICRRPVRRALPQHHRPVRTRHDGDVRPARRREPGVRRQSLPAEPPDRGYARAAASRYSRAQPLLQRQGPARVAAPPRPRAGQAARLHHACARRAANSIRSQTTACPHATRAPSPTTARATAPAPWARSTP